MPLICNWNSSSTKFLAASMGTRDMVYLSIYFAWTSSRTPTMEITERCEMRYKDWLRKHQRRWLNAWDYTSRPLLTWYSSSVIDNYFCVFMRNEFWGIMVEHNSAEDWPDDQSINLLIERSDCLFIYAATACHFIDNSDWCSQEHLDLILQGDTIEE